MTIEETFNQLRAGSEQFRLTTAEERLQRLDAMWQGLVDCRPQLVKAAYNELRVDEEGVLGQMMMVKAEVDFAKKHLAKWMKPRRVKNSSATIGKKCYVRPQAKGVVLNLSTWNAPICISFVPAIAALAAGNTVCIKPSELAPETAELIGGLVNKTFDPSEVAAVNGGAEVSQELLRQPFNHIYYTGGQRVGSIVMKAAADHFAGVTLEMGGKNPTIIDATADIKDAARKTAWGRLVNSGQACVSPDYVVIEESVCDEFIGHLSAFIESMFDSDGKGLANSPYLPVMLNDQQYQRVEGLVEDATSKGASVRFGGSGDATSRFYSPTILSDVTEDMTIMHQEVFGPIVAVIPFKTREEAVEIVNRRRKSLSLYIFSQDKDNIEYFTQRTESGGMCINHNVVHAGTNPHLPFGGINASGIGRIGGYRGFIEMSNERGVLEQPLGWRDFNVNFPPYTKFFRKMIRAGIK